MMVSGLLAIAALSPPPARAIPAFARREGVPCQMCHFREPELNAEGRAYLLRGFRLAPSGAAAASPAPTAQEERPLGTPGSLDVGHYVSVFGSHSFTAARHEASAFDAGEVDLFIAGPANPQWSVEMNPVFDIQNGGADVGQAYGQFITRQAKQFASVRAGQISPFAIHYNQGDMRMPLTPPASLDASGDTGYGWAPSTPIRGVELSAVSLPGWNVTLGAGQPKVDAPPDVADFKRHTDVYASAETNLGSSGNSLTAYGYLGHAWLSPEATNSQFHRLGLFANLYLGAHRLDGFNAPTKAVLGVLTGKDKDANGKRLGNTGYFALAERQVSERLAAYARYDNVRLDLSDGGSVRQDGPTLGITYWPATEVRLTAEGQSLKTKGQSRDNRLAIEFLWIL
jgi:hypothetical protein